MAQPTIIPIVALASQPQAGSATKPRAMPESRSDFAGLIGIKPRDTLRRPLRDLRISVTDRCNFRCTYCMPRSVFTPDYPYLARSELLSFDEITRFAQIAVDAGVEKIRLTGGEPLLRKDLPTLVAQLAAIKNAPELTLTTNAALLAKFAKPLKDAGLSRITVSLDALDDAVFKRMNDADFAVAQVLGGIDAALAAGFEQIKVNCVVQRTVNLNQVLPLAQHFRASPVTLRFIEFMDVGASNGWRMDDVVPSQTLVDLIHVAHPIQPLDRHYPGEVAQRWAYADGAGELGFISSVTQPFCSDCSRLRLSTNGQLYTCLFAQQGWDVRSLLRDTSLSDTHIAGRLATLWQQRSDQYSTQRTLLSQADNAALAKVEMSFIGG